jgi:hypothetical protein
VGWNQLSIAVASGGNSKFEKNGPYEPFHPYIWIKTQLEFAVASGGNSKFE